MRKKLLLSFFGILCLTALHAQKVDKYLFLGKEAEDKGELAKAVQIYSEGARLITTSSKLDFRYAELLRNLNDYELAEKYYKRTLENDSINEYPAALYWLATIQKNNGDYKAALSNWELIKRQNEKDPQSEVYKKALQELRSVSAVLSGEIPIFSYKIRNMEELNTYNAEFGSAYYDSTSMVFSKLNKSYDRKKPADFIELHAAIKDAQGWRDAGVLPPSINQTGFQNANGHFSDDGKFFVFSRCEESANCMIYISVYRNGVYSEAFPIKVNAPGSISTQPHLAKTNEGYALFFSSNRAGGQGGFDLWYALADDQLNLQEAKNLTAVNTAEDEITPFYYARTGELFFSSTWHIGLGGFDIFKSKSTDLKTFSEPKNIGKPFNSPANDFYFSLSPRGYKGTLTSNREGSRALYSKTCCNDLYEFDYPAVLIEQLPADYAERVKAISEPTAQIKKLYAEMVSLLPLTLYFHNDEPDPKSVKDFTLQNYRDCYYSYYSVKSRYDDVNRTQSEIIYNQLVQTGYDKLSRYLAITKELMALDAAIELDIKGYASPLAKSKYNVNLTSRRIETFMNYLKVYDEGSLLPFVIRQGNQPRIGVKKLPFGEYKSATGVSDDYYNQPLSVYSLGAAKERRIEIVATRLILPENRYVEVKPKIEPAATPLMAELQPKEQQEETKTQSKPTETASSDQKLTEKAPETVKNEAETAPTIKKDSVKLAAQTPLVKPPKKRHPGNSVIIGETTKKDTSAIAKIDPQKATEAPKTTEPKEETQAPLFEDPTVDEASASSNPLYLTNRIDLDLGRIKRGPLFVKKLRFKNTYGMNINLTRVKADCSCTDVRVNTNVLVPDEETEFTFLLETRGKVGVHEGVATIFTKQINGHITIHYKVEIVP